jgi:hypothetical protein
MPKAINFEKTKGLMKMVQDPNFDKFAKQAAAGNAIDFNLDESMVGGNASPMLNSLPSRGTQEEATKAKESASSSYGSRESYWCHLYSQGGFYTQAKYI